MGLFHISICTFDDDGLFDSSACRFFNDVIFDISTYTFDRGLFDFRPIHLLVFYFMLVFVHLLVFHFLLV